MWRLKERVNQGILLSVVFELSESGATMYYAEKSLRRSVCRDTQEMGFDLAKLEMPMRYSSNNAIWKIVYRSLSYVK